MPPNPETTVARHVHGRGATGAGSPDGARGPRGRRQPFSARERASTCFRARILRREDVEFLGRKPETGGTRTLPGVEFVRYRGSCGLGFRQTAPKTPEWPLRAVFRASGGTGLDGRHRFGQEPTHGRILTPMPVTAQGCRLAVPMRITSAGSSATTGLRSAAAPATGFGGWSTSPPAAPAPGRKRGVRGGAAPRQPPQGTHGVWPQGLPTFCQRF